MVGITAKAITRAVTICAVALSLTGCTSSYLDSTIQPLAPGQRVRVANPQPVQILFEFQTKGTLNGQGTELTRPFVLDATKASGLFSQISTTPVSNGALLKITLNNVPLTDDAYARGAVTGLTLGLAGTTVGDGYICTISYQSRPGVPEITQVNRNAIYTSIGATSGPKQAVEKMKDILEAVSEMTRRTVDSNLNDLANNPGFPK